MKKQYSRRQLILTLSGLFGLLIPRSVTKETCHNTFQQRVSNTPSDNTFVNSAYRASQSITNGAWIYSFDQQHMLDAAETGFPSTRGYSLDQALATRANAIQAQVSHLGGIHIESEQAIADWQSQIQSSNVDLIKEIAAQQLPLSAICIGNELRDSDCAPCPVPFTPRLADNLVKIIKAYKQMLEDQGLDVKLSYAMQGNVIDLSGHFFDWIHPVIEACDIVSINLYPMDAEDWFGTGAYKENRRFLTNLKVQERRFDQFEQRLICVLEQLKTHNKLLLLSETGFPSGVSYEMRGDEIVPIHDLDAFQDAYEKFLIRLVRINQASHFQIQGIYLYEWLDNPSHPKIWSENSPIHNCFGLCTSDGTPKFDFQRIRQIMHSV